MYFFCTHTNNQDGDALSDASLVSVDLYIMLKHIRFVSLNTNISPLNYCCLMKRISISISYSVIQQVAHLNYLGAYTL